MIDAIGGELLSAYCTCRVGLNGSYNHEAGLLFRVEATVLTGLSSLNYTSVSAAWNIPTVKKQKTPDEISKFIYTNDAYIKSNTKVKRSKERKSRRS